MTFDWFLILTPVLLLPIIAVLRFIGCYNPADIPFGNVVFDGAAANCGGPVVEEGGVTFLDDSGEEGSAGVFRFQVTGGSSFKLSNSPPVKDPDGTNASPIFQTCRTGTDFTYEFSLATGAYRMILHFAEIGTANNPGDRVFSFTITGIAGTIFNLPDGSNAAYDIVAKSGGRLIAHQEELEVVTGVGADHFLTLRLIGGSSPEPNALINAIQLIPTQKVTISPGSAPIIEGQSQQFSAVASWDASAAITWSVSGPGAISPSGLFTAPAGITVKTPTVVQATATFEGTPITESAAVSIYPHRDATTKGNWIGKYGVDGFVLANLPQDANHTKLPAYAGQFSALRLDGTVLDVFTFPGSAGDVRSLKEFDGSPRPTIVWNDASSLILSFDFLDSQPHLFSIYCVDFDRASPARDQTITVLNADTNAVLAQEQLQAFTEGIYLLWVFSGRIKITVKPNVRNAVVSAVFFG